MQDVTDQLRMALAGLFAPISTPFDLDEEVDLGALRFNMGRYAASGIHGYLAFGSNGENRSLEWPHVLEAPVHGNAARRPRRAPKRVVAMAASQVRRSCRRVTLSRLRTRPRASAQAWQYR